MNGRVYDPVVGRFLSVDLVVSDPLNAQNYNGYSYCVNNPLKYTDPSGYQQYAMPMPDFEPGAAYYMGRLFGHGGSGSSFNSYCTGGSTYYGERGEHGNGCGLDGNYYDWKTGSYRTIYGDVTSFSEVFRKSVLPNEYKEQTSLQFNPPGKPFVNTIINVKDLKVYVDKNFGKRLPENIKLTWQIWDNNYGLTVSSNKFNPDASLTVSIPSSFLSDPTGLLYDCIDHEIVHINDFASGRAFQCYLEYMEWSSAEAIMEYRAYSRNQWYNDNYRNGHYNYTDKINEAKGKLPRGFL